MPNVIVNVATSAASAGGCGTGPAAASAAAARCWLTTNAAIAATATTASTTSQPGASVRPSTSTIVSAARPTTASVCPRDVDARGLVVPGLGQVAARHQQRQQPDRHVQPEDVAPADRVGQHAAQDRPDRGAHRGGHRPRRGGPCSFDRVGERCGGDRQALRQHQRRADALHRPRRQQHAEATARPRTPARRRRRPSSRCAAACACRTGRRATRRDSSTRSERDVVGVDRPLRSGDAAAEIVADGGQRQVDRVGVDQPDEKAQVGRDQRERLTGG